jgi:hypothetical protein
MKFEWKVKVTDKAGAAITDAEVALAQKAALAGKEYPFDGVITFAHKSGGNYEPSSAITPAAGDWSFIVRRKGSSPAVQPLKMTAGKDGDFSPAPTGGAVQTVAMHSTSKSGSRSTDFAVTLFAASEVVFLVGVDIEDKAMVYLDSAKSRARKLLIDKTIDAGTRITVFACEDRAKMQFAAGAAQPLVLVASKSFGTTPRPKPAKANPPAAGTDISALDFYTHISDAGTAEPGRVKEVSIFSHAFPGGPILFDTNDKTPNSDARDPNDFDLRKKDWNPVNTALFPNLKAAMDPKKGFWQIWGCSATAFFKEMMNDALGKDVTTDTQLFKATTDLKHDNGSPSEHDEAVKTREHLRVFVHDILRGTSELSPYMSHAAKFLGLPVFGAPPGVGTDFAHYPAKPEPFQVMGVYSAAPSFTFIAGFKPPIIPSTDKFYSGFIDYNEMLSMKLHPPPRAPDFNTAVYTFFIDFDDKLAVLSFDDLGTPGQVHKSVNVKLTQTAQKGFFAKNESGHLYVLDDTDPAKSEAFYLQTTGDLFRVTRDPKTNAFTLVNPTPL